MAYFIFEKNNIDLFKIAENSVDLNNLNGVSTSHYNIVEDNQINFNNVKYGTKFPQGVQDGIITYVDMPKLPFTKEFLSNYIKNYKYIIKNFLDNSPNNPSFNSWNNYYNQLSNLNLDTITYPLNISLEQYFKDLNQPSYHPLQLP